jgi:hypothetical protein
MEIITTNQDKYSYLLRNEYVSAIYDEESLLQFN